MDKPAPLAGQPEDQADSLLLAAVLDGQTAAFAGIMRHHNQRLFRLARSIVTDDAGAMDVVQESYIAAYDRLGDLQDPAALGLWLAHIVRNTALMRLRHNRRYLFMDDADLENVLELTVPQSPKRQPEGEVANTQLRQLLEECMDGLPGAFRAVFMLRAVEQCSTQETARILDIREATVKTRYHRAKHLMQERLLAWSDAAGVDLHEFGGRRCDTLTRQVMASLREQR